MDTSSQLYIGGNADKLFFTGFVRELFISSTAYASSIDLVLPMRYFAHFHSYKTNPRDAGCTGRNTILRQI